jgi:hypothetical protein
LLLPGVKKNTLFFSKVLSAKAEGKGFEPLLTDPESAVLPLDEPPLIDGVILS